METSLKMFENLEIKKYYLIGRDYLLHHNLFRIILQVNCDTFYLSSNVCKYINKIYFNLFVLVFLNVK